VGYHEPQEGAAALIHARLGAQLHTTEMAAGHVLWCLYAGLAVLIK